MAVMEVMDEMKRVAMESFILEVDFSSRFLDRDKQVFLLS